VGQEFYEVGSGLSVPGLEAVLEYGDASTVKRDRIPRALLMNDRRHLEVVRFKQVDGIHSTAEQRDSRQVNSDLSGETAGNMLYGGRTIGLSGEIEAGSIPAVRDTWSRFSSQFGLQEQDLLIHGPSEVRSYVNELINPTWQSDFEGWTLLYSSGTPSTDNITNDGFISYAGEYAISGMDSGVKQIVVDSDFLADWDGEDIFVRALMKVEAADGSDNLLRMFITCNLSDGGSSGYLADSEGTPAVGTWYEVSARVTASDLPANTTGSIGLTLQMDCDTDAGDYTLRVAKAMMVLLDPSDPTPAGYFDGDTNCFEWLGKASRSRSIGPTHAVNFFHDALIENVQPSGLLTRWANKSAAGLTVNQAPVPTRMWRGDHTSAGYAKYTKAADTSSRIMGVQYSVYFEVSAGRSYRLSMSLNVLQLPATGTGGLSIEWFGADTNLISSSVATDLTAGIGSYSIEATAPAGAQKALLSFAMSGVVTPSAEFEVMWSDPCFIDTTDWNPGDFYGDGLFESSPEASLDLLAKKLIPRPFLIKAVRKASDLKYVEQQQNRRFTRDFTVGLRASDPRIYVLDERRTQIQMSGTPELASHQAPGEFTLATAGLPVPSGYTYEGHFITHPGIGTTFKWDQYAAGGGFAPNDKHPLGGVGPWVFDQYGVAGGNHPSQDLKTRVYRSLEGYEYETPKVILGCSPQGYSFNYPNYQHHVQGGSAGSKTFYYNDATILLKRIASGTWLELRWNSLSKGFADTYNPGSGEPNAPHAFELWSSHDLLGTPGSPTKLAGWDYESINSASGFLPFRPATDPMWLVSWMLNDGTDDVVYWELWNTYPSTIDIGGKLESGSYVIPSALAAVIGTSDAGEAGWSLRIPNGPDQATFSLLASVTPYMHYYESFDATLQPETSSSSVIGTIETPQVIQLRGDLIDPVLQISVPAFDDKPAKTSVARFIGTMQESSPVTIDLSGSEISVTDASGIDRSNMVVPGSSFEMLRPGINHITLQAKGWSDQSTHCIASWRDALASG
jgi:hypothetical protein